MGTVMEMLSDVEIVNLGMAGDNQHLYFSSMDYELYKAYLVVEPFINWESLGLPSRGIDVMKLKYSTTQIPKIVPPQVLVDSGMVGNMSDRFNAALASHPLPPEPTPPPLTPLQQFFDSLKDGLVNFYMTYVFPPIVLSADTYVAFYSTPYTFLLGFQGLVDTFAEWVYAGEEVIDYVYSLTHYSTTRGSLPPPHPIFAYNYPLKGFFEHRYDDLLRYRMRNVADGYSIIASRTVTCHPYTTPIFVYGKFELYPIFDSSHYLARSIVPNQLMALNPNLKVNTLGLALNYVIDDQSVVQFYSGFFFSPDCSFISSTNPNPNSFRFCIGVHIESSSSTRVTILREYIPYWEQ